jgi:stearoyl-CoA desaturase (delta-9 desaturase)
LSQLENANGVLAGNNSSQAAAKSTSRQLITYIVVLLPTVAFAYGMYLVWENRVTTLDMILLSVMFVLTLVGIEGGFHRLISHRAFKTYPLVRNLFVIFGSMASQGPVIFWAATHRQHHAYTDEVGDPHSPVAGSQGFLGRIIAFTYGHCRWLFANENTDWARFGADLIKDKSLFRLNQTYFTWVVLGLIIPAIIGGIATLSWEGAFGGLLWGGLIRIFLVHHTVWSVNSLCHLFGSQPFAVGGNSKNNLILALPTFGGAWHNNHHAFPRAANNSFKWWQIDIIGLIIVVLSRIGLAWELYIPTRQSILDKTNFKKNNPVVNRN